MWTFSWKSHQQTSRFNDCSIENITYRCAMEIIGQHPCWPTIIQEMWYQLMLRHLSSTSAELVVCPHQAHTMWYVYSRLIGIGWSVNKAFLRYAICLPAVLWSQARYRYLKLTLTLVCSRIAPLIISWLTTMRSSLSVSTGMDKYWPAKICNRHFLIFQGEFHICTVSSGSLIGYIVQYRLMF